MSDMGAGYEVRACLFSICYHYENSQMFLEAEFMRP